MRRDALVVGINLYPSLKDTSTSKAKNLITPAVDAEKIAQLLEADQDFRVIRLPASRINGKLQVDPNKPVSKDELLEAITKLFLTSEDLDTALLFFAGHGLKEPLGTLKKTLLATSDANPQSKKWNGLLLRDLWEIIEQSPVKEQIIWIDCCYGGELLNFKENEFPNAHNRFLIAASHSSEVAYERFDGQHGVLSGALIEGLDSDKIDHHSWITARTLGVFVDTQLKKYYAETKIPQLPQIRTPDQEIRLIKGKSQPSINQQSDTNKSLEHKIPLVLPQLELDVSKFTGRDQELKQLEDLLLKPQGTKFCSIAGLTGVGGIGKSALACHFATIHKADFPDGVIGLRVDGKDVNTIAREFVRKFDKEIDLEDERDAATIMQEVFADRSMLLIFDNAENDSIRQLRPGGNRCAVIVTTRDRGLAISLEIPNESRINLPPLPEADALLLLEKLIDRKRVQAEPEAARQMIELVGYLPIAIKIIGSQLSLDEWRSLARHAKRLTEERQIARIKFGDSEHLDLFACFSVSLAYLQPDEIDFFACLSVCAKNGFSLLTAMVATGCDEYATEDYLSKLYRLSLINYSEVEKDRFVFHPLIHQFATEKAIELGLQEEAAARHSEYFIQFINREINPVVAKEIAAELDEIILAAQWLQQQKITSKFQETDKYNFAVCLQPFFEQYGYWEEAVDFMLGFEKLAESNEDWEKVIKFRIQQAKYLSLQGKWSAAEELIKSDLISKVLDKIEEESTRQLSEAKWLNTLGGILMRQGKFDEAVRVFKRAVGIEEQLNNQEGLTIILNSLGGLLRRQGSLNEAEEILNRSYAISEQLNDKRHTAFVLHNLGMVFLEQNRLNEAFYNLERSYAVFKELGYQRGLLITLNSLGGVLRKQGKLDEAIKAIQESAAIEEKLDDKRNLIIKSNLLGGLYQQQGRIDQAIKSFERAITIAQETDNKQQLAITLSQLGGLYQEQGRIDEAVQSFEYRLTIDEETDNKQSLAITLTQLGGLYQKQGRIEEAIQSFKDAIAIAKKTDNKQQLAIILTQLGGLYQKRGRIEEAIQSFKDAIAIAKKTGNKQQLAIILTQLGGFYQEEERIDEAIKSFKRAIAIAKETDDKQQLAITLTQLGGLYQKQRRIEEAVQSLEDAIAIEQEIDDKYSLTITLKRLAGLYQQQGRIEEAIQSLEHLVTFAEGTDNKQLLKSILKKSLLDYILFLCNGYVSYVSANRETQKIHNIEMILRRCYELFVKLDDKKQQAIVLNSLGKVIHKKGGEENFQLALTFFRESIKLSDQMYSATVHAAIGEALLVHGDITQAAEKFRLCFEINEKLTNSRGLIKVTSQLTDILVWLGKREEAINYCQRALEIAIYPDNQIVVELCNELVNPNPLKKGTVKFIKTSKQGKLYGFIAPDDGSDDIYLTEDSIKYIFKLQKGSRVEVEVKQEAQGSCAKSLRILTNDKSA
ncbi:hypothetical protein A4S05_24965 [Nostoc sp. KVJ20]|uniref:tetratricopeptide repeat protein n=1 Tax=Nostoc sp. KVJ20 TaxID=457944 RepID=UPI00083E0CB5|nr:tetratricopeptide repeat protein [Nostoc sp. KVJ20]ODH02278.1 hypothetical protein A4S05_24965 [Nostoc sp. KVJ20]